MTELCQKSAPEEELQQLRSRLNTEAERLLTLATRALKTAATPANPEAAPTVDELKFHEFRISALSWLSRVFGDDHTTTTAFRNEVISPTAARARRGAAIVAAAQQELQGDWLQTTKGELFVNMLTGTLRRAKRQQEDGNLRAAAILCGSVIDEMLYRLAARIGLSPVNTGQSGRARSKKPLQLTGELYREKVYPRETRKKLVTAVELYNECAKDTDKIPEEKQVATMLHSVETILRGLKL